MRDSIDNPHNKIIGACVPKAFSKQYIHIKNLNTKRKFEKKQYPDGLDAKIS
jgi:hypothetical protein